MSQSIKAACVNSLRAAVAFSPAYTGPSFHCEGVLLSAVLEPEVTPACAAREAAMTVMFSRSTAKGLLPPSLFIVAGLAMSPLLSMCATTMRIGPPRTRERYANRSANLDMSCGGKQDSLLPSARGPAPSLRGRRLDSDNFVLSEQVSLSQSEPRVTLSPWAALGVADSSISPVVICFSTRASPEDWRFRASDVAKDGDRWRSLSDRDGLTRSEWCAGRHRLPADACFDIPYLRLTEDYRLARARLLRLK
jgi:hypothetical protein